MYFQREAMSGARVLKMASRLEGASTAKRLVAAAGTIGAGARAISSALVTESTPSSVEKTTSFRVDFFMAPPIYATQRGATQRGGTQRGGVDRPTWPGNRPIKRAACRLQKASSAKGRFFL